MQLGTQQGDGSTLRAHLLAAAAQGAPADARLSAQVPRHAAALWACFADLSAARPSTMAGAGAVPPSEVLAWQQLHGVRLSPWELDTLADMDRAALAVVAEQQNKKAKH